ncbi:hypothetical protein NKI61_30795, partial [Mesorhizobium sp. M0514]|uniref:hypothetical protein n=1 Tax=Mesorhizobium sp. M0514 TaxID=2956955 RepID=UPI00333C37C1
RGEGHQQQADEPCDNIDQQDKLITRLLMSPADIHLGHWVGRWTFWYSGHGAEVMVPRAKALGAAPVALYSD